MQAEGASALCRLSLTVEHRVRILNFEFVPELARAMGPDWQIILDTPHPVGSPMAAMVNRDKIAITVELGGGATLMPDALQHNVDAVLARADLV